MKTFFLNNKNSNNSKKENLPIFKTLWFRFSLTKGKIVNPGHIFKTRPSTFDIVYNSFLKIRAVLDEGIIIKRRRGKFKRTKRKIRRQKEEKK